jgi:hypothetical protein
MIEELLAQTSPRTLVVGVVVICVVVALTRRISTERRIRALGGHTSRIQTWIPYGLCC